MTEFEKIKALAIKFRNVLKNDESFDLGIYDGAMNYVKEKKGIENPLDDIFNQKDIKFLGFSIYKHEHSELFFSLDYNDSDGIFRRCLFFELDNPLQNSPFLYEKLSVTVDVTVLFMDVLEYYEKILNEPKSLEFCRKMLEIIRKGDTISFREIESSLINFGTICNNKRDLSKFKKAYKKLHEVENAFLFFSTYCVMTDESDILEELENEKVFHKVKR